MDADPGCRLSAGRLCAQQNVSKFSRQIMMIGDDDGQAGVFGHADPFCFRDTCVAGQQQVWLKVRVMQDLLQLPGADAMPFTETIGHMKADMGRRGKLLQRGHQQGCAGLTVYIKIAPDKDISAPTYSIDQ